ncbi:uncharacterized protein [Macrobrachium rosenbergii]|uniref:uncharacterized protein n=1 Tax=Macrobrachium rosenbergii TaxID=79674 RepID=UPI0034D3E5BE
MQYFDCRPKTNNERRNRPVTNKTLPVHSTPTFWWKKSCLHCDKTGHDIEKCYVFGGLSVNDRWDSVTSKRMLQVPSDYESHHGDCKEALTAVSVVSTPITRSCTRSISLLQLKEPVHQHVKKKNASRGGNQMGASETESATTPNPEAEPAPAHVHATSCPDGRTMLKIVPALINGTHATYAFIDSGSAPTLVTKGLVEKLGLQGRSCNQKMITEAGTFMCREVVSLEIGNIDGSESDHISEAFVTDRINISTDHLMPTEWLGQWPHLREVELHTLPEAEQEVEVIIGLNTTLNRIILINAMVRSTSHRRSYEVRLGYFRANGRQE